MSGYGETDRTKEEPGKEDDGDGLSPINFAVRNWWKARRAKYDFEHSIELKEMLMKRQRLDEDHTNAGNELNAVMKQEFAERNAARRGEHTDEPFRVMVNMTGTTPFVLTLYPSKTRFEIEEMDEEAFG